MNTKTKKMLNAGESETVEFKLSFDREAIETLVAFANTSGGKVFIGVTNKGEIKGTEVGKETVKNWINDVKQYTSQAIIPDAEAIKIKGKNIVILSVQESPIKPVACRGRYYKRIKNSNHQLTASEVAAMHLRTFNTSWDYHIDALHTKKDISLKKVKAFIQQANANRESPIQDDPMTVLQKLELIRDGKITYACFLLFMSEESSLSTIELGRFQTDTIIKDGDTLKADLFSEVDGVVDFIKKHINKAYIITGRPQREERWDYPLNAIREIVINAVIHRDYTSSADSIIKVYDDKIEFFNPGKLPEGLTITKLLKGDYVSIARNKKIAEAFKSAGLIEKYGSGIKRILNGFKEYGLPTPEFREMSSGFMVTVYKKTEQVGTKLALSRDQVGTKSGIESRIESGIESRILLTLQKYHPLGMKGLSEALGWSKPNRYLHQAVRLLIEKVLIERTIPDKPNSRFQKYRLTDKGKRHIKKLPEK